MARGDCLSSPAECKWEAQEGLWPVEHCVPVGLTGGFVFFFFSFFVMKKMKHIKLQEIVQ